MGKHLITLAGIRAIAQRAAAVAHDDGGVRAGLGQIDQIAQLMEKHPGVQTQAQGCEFGHPLAELGSQVDARYRAGVADDGVWVVAGGGTYPPEPPLPRLNMGLQHGPHRRAQAQVGRADDARANARLAWSARVTSDADGGGKFSLAHRLEGRRAAVAVAVVALHVDRGQGVMAAVHVLRELLEQVGVVFLALSLRQGCWQGGPEVMVGINDG